MIDRLDPYWADFSASGAGELWRLPGQGAATRVSEALLSVTDARAAASDRPTIIRAYRRRPRQRGQARHGGGCRAVGALVQKYAG